jgi:predicted PhzF superfamily epimerase YddE/YHI9
LKTLRLFQVDAFTDRVFGGNPAAVVPLDAWLEDDLMAGSSANTGASAWC